MLKTVFSHFCLAFCQREENTYISILPAKIPGLRFLGFDWLSRGHVSICEPILMAEGIQGLVSCTGASAFETKGGWGGCMRKADVSRETSRF
jgi:hypothetical protein